MSCSRKVGWAVELCSQITDVASWYRNYRVFEESEDAPATGPAVDETAYDDSDAESSSSDDDDIVAPVAGTSHPPSQDSQGPSQRKQPRARKRAPLRVIDLEDGEPHSFPIHTIIIVGHAGSQLESNTGAFLALGIPLAKHKDLLLELSVNAVQRTHHCLVHYKRLWSLPRRLRSRRCAACRRRLLCTLSYHGTRATHTRWGGRVPL